MGYETIRWEVSEGVATLTLNRPEVLNAITERMLAELADAMKQAERETAVRAIVLTGAGRGFCAGQDLQAIKDAYAGGGAPAFGDILRKQYNLERMLEVEAQLQVIAGRTQDHREGVLAFLEKRPPKCEGT